MPHDHPASGDEEGRAEVSELDKLQNTANEAWARADQALETALKATVAYLAAGGQLVDWHGEALDMVVRCGGPQGALDLLRRRGEWPKPAAPGGKLREV